MYRLVFSQKVLMQTCSGFFVMKDKHALYTFLQIVMTVCHMMYVTSYNSRLLANKCIELIDFTRRGQKYLLPRPVKFFWRSPSYERVHKMFVCFFY